MKQESNPIAQSFFLPNLRFAGADGVNLTGIDLFFKQVGDASGFNVWICDCDGGTPNPKKEVPGSFTRVIRNQIKVSSNAQTPTHVLFKSPVYLKVDHRYAVCVEVDGGNPNLLIWISEQGKDDVHLNKPVPSNFELGAFFTSSGGAYTPITNQDLKFDLYVGMYKVNLKGTVNMTNADLEFLTLDTTSGAFVKPEEVFQVPTSFINGTITANASSRTLSGSSTKFSTEFSAGDTIAIVANSTVADVVTIESVESNTSLTLEGAPTFSATCNGAITPCGIAERYETKDGVVTMHISNSSAKTGSVFTAGKTLRGANTNATANIASIDVLPVSYFHPNLARIAPTGAHVFTTFTSTNKDDITDTETRNIIYGAKNHIPNFEGGVHSKSLEITNNSGAKSFVVTSKMSSTNKWVTPVVDGDVSKLETYKYIINSNSANERTFGQGVANTKYLSKTVTLAPGIDSEDLNVYISGYRPSNTSFEVYAKLINQSDSDTLVDRQWTKLIEEDAQKELFSSDRHMNDVKEFKFTVPEFPTADSTNVQTGTANTTADSTSVPCNGSNFSQGDLIAITDGTFDIYQVGRVESANSTLVTLSSAADISITNGKFYKVNADEKRAAFKQRTNSGATFKLRYFDSAGREFEAFNAFQIKVVFLADQTRRVPRINDVRAVALSA